MENERKGTGKWLNLKCTSCTPSTKEQRTMKEIKFARGSTKETSADNAAVKAQQALLQSRRRLSSEAANSTVVAVYQINTAAFTAGLPAANVFKYLSQGAIQQFDRCILSDHGHINLPIRGPIRSVPSLLS